MNIDRPKFSCPVICIDNFFLTDDAERVLQECIDLRKVYMPAKVFDGPTASKIDNSFRTNTVVYLDDIFRSSPERSDILKLFRQKIWDDECRRIWHEGYLLFDIINYSTWQEAVISCYTNGSFYKSHQDTRRDHITYRLVTLVYYVNTQPTHFKGGALVLKSGEESFKIAPQHNRAVIFPSFVMHEVEAVEAPDVEWHNNRFSINYWIGFR
jgi:hypothetical protein